MENAQRPFGNKMQHVETRSKFPCQNMGLEERFHPLQRTASTPSRLAGKNSLAPALTANWLIIMAGVAFVAYGSASALAADEYNSTSEQNGSKWSVIIGGGGAYAPDYEGSDDYEFQPFPFASIVYDDFIFIKGTSLGANLVNYDGFKVGPIAPMVFTILALMFGGGRPKSQASLRKARKTIRASSRRSVRAIRIALPTP